MKNNYTGNIGLDFIDAYGLRNTSFQLVTTKYPGGRVEADAIIEIVGGSVTRILCTKALEGKLDAIKRMAFIWLGRSTPQRFGKSGCMA